MGVFIEVTVNSELLSSEQGEAIVRLCPVDIFGLVDNQLVVKTENEDECTLCRLCLEAAPRDAIVIHKTYNGEKLTSTGTG